jgi:eukaryotic-like serine/threonine-protein kinase
MTVPPLPIQVGEIIAAKYEVLEILGVGGMGFVVAAWHPALKTKVALKFMRPDIAKIPEAMRRFKHEAQLMAGIQSIHAIKVHDVGVHGDLPYIMMEYLEGQTLAELLGARSQAGEGPLPAQRAVAYILQACEAIAEAHAAGIVHRDLKPANLFLTESKYGPLVKVCDFGIAKGRPGEETAMTSAGQFLGSPMYSAPEQLKSSAAVDARSDIWALGVILFELLAGVAPFRADDPFGVALLITTTRAPDLRATCQGLPPALGDVVARCLEPEPASRVQNVDELMRLLAPFAPAGANDAADRVWRRFSSRPPANEQPTEIAAEAPLVGSVGTVVATPDFRGAGAAIDFNPTSAAGTQPLGFATGSAAPSKRSPVFPILALGAAAIGIVGAGVGLGLRGASSSRVSVASSAAVHALTSAAEPNEPLKAAESRVVSARVDPESAPPGATSVAPKRPSLRPKPSVSAVLPVAPAASAPASVPPTAKTSDGLFK